MNCQNQDLPDLRIYRISTYSENQCNPVNPIILEILILTTLYGRSGMGRFSWFSAIWSVSQSLAKL